MSTDDARQSDATQQPRGASGTPDVVVAPPIRLGQFLQLAGLADSGTEARDLIAAGDVRVDGEAEVRRGRQLHGGELVQIASPHGILGARVVTPES